MRKAFYIERIQSLNCEALQHLHVESEILYFETGHGVLQIHDSALPVRGYQMCIIPPATPHSLKLTGNNVLYRCLVPFVPQDAPINRLVDDIAFLEMRNIFATMYRLFNQKDMVHPVALFYHFIRALCELAQERRAPAGSLSRAQYVRYFTHRLYPAGLYRARSVRYPAPFGKLSSCSL